MATDSTEHGPHGGARRGVGPWSFDAFTFHAGGWGTDASRRFCLNAAKGHYENFPVMMSLFPNEVRDGLASVYAFARAADDFADEPQFEGVRGRLLDQWETQLDRCFAGEASHPVFVALRETVTRFNLDRQPFNDLLDAFRQDCVKNRYATHDELLGYCRRSANPVGRIVLKILGLDLPELPGWSDDICTALQLTNFWQDLSVDIARNRLYLPREDLDRFGVAEASLLSGRASPAAAALVRFEVERTRHLFRRGRPLILNTGLPEQIYFAGVWLGGRTVLRMVNDLGAEVLHRRPRLRTGALALVWLKAAPRKFLAYTGGAPWTP